ncbi:PREDICTED: T-cell surface antigen CD2 [Elephantulus edwardii]|uniref:T-cell surface antigen CD2 n=1 Tax=Elephantulus edwardii TaxID=28737 RepID=UPI0003F0EAF5|nr:PREDICTED: T-cell surface antigen CD2 [Elephantulus edwardii]
MSLPCKILASCLLIYNFPTEGAVPEKTVSQWGKLYHNIHLDGPDLNTDEPSLDDMDNVRWYMGQNKTKIGQFKRGMQPQSSKIYEVFENGTLEIKNLTRNSDNIYTAEIFNKSGVNVLVKTIYLKVLEVVSKPQILYNCDNRTLTCKVTKGSDPELQLSQNGSILENGAKTIITYTWTSNQSLNFICTASNNVSREDNEENIQCPEKGLNIYLILTVVGGGIVVFIFVALLIFCIGKKRKQNDERNDEDPEIRAHRITTEEKVRKPHQIPGSTFQKPATSQPPPPPSHRPRPVGNRVQQQQQQKRPLPPQSVTQVHLQKGPPLPRPRAHQKPPPSST